MASQVTGFKTLRPRSARAGSATLAVRAFATVAAVASSALAETSAWAGASARLTYVRPAALAGCADEVDLRRAIAERIGRDPIVATAPIRVTISITRTEARLVAEVTLASGSGEPVGSRTLEAPVDQCGELTATLALTVAIALDTIENQSPPEARDGPSDTPLAHPPQPDPTPPEDPFAGARRALETPPRPRAREPAWPRFELGIGVTGAPVGIAPVPSAGATASGALRWPGFDLGAEGWVGLPASARAGAVPNARVRTSLNAGGVSACRHLGDYVFGCAVGFVGSLRAEAPGVPGATTGSALEVLAGPRAGVTLALGLGWSLRASVDVLVDATRPGVRAGGESIWQSPPFAVAGQAAAMFQIP